MNVPPGNLPLCTHRYLMLVSYLGSKFKGSQRLNNRDAASTQNTVQETLEWSLETFLPKKRCKLTASSRTDKGVHALINCYTLPLMDFERSTEYLRKAINQNLIKNNHDLSVNDVLLVPADFHPRKNVLGREYIYRIAVFDQSKYSIPTKKNHAYNTTHLLPIMELYKVLPVTSFNLEKAQEVIELFNGEHDFASFAKKEGSEDIPNTSRDMSISMTKLDPYVFSPDLPNPYSLYQIHFKSQAFLYNQVRRMVGTILSYASYDRTDLNRIKFLLSNPSSTNWSGNMIIAEPWGLFLSRITYSKSSFKGAIRIMEDNTEVSVDESNLPATLGLGDDNLGTESESEHARTSGILE